MVKQKDKSGLEQIAEISNLLVDWMPEASRVNFLDDCYRIAKRETENYEVHLPRETVEEIQEVRVLDQMTQMYDLCRGQLHPVEIKYSRMSEAQLSACVERIRKNE